MKLDDDARKYESALYAREFAKLPRELKQDLDKVRASANRLNPPISQVSKILCDTAEKEIKAFLISKLETHKKFAIDFDTENENEVFDEVRRRIDKYVIFAESSDFPEFRLPNSSQMIPNITSVLRSELERLLSDVKSEIDIFTSERKMEENMLKKSETKEYKVLKWIYDKAEGEKAKQVELDGLPAESTEFHREKVGAISDYLKDAGFIEHPHNGNFIVTLTHKGIKEIKFPSELKKPASAPPIHNIYGSVGNIGDNYGTIQQGKTNIQINSLSDANNLEQKIDELIRTIKSSSLSELQKITTESHLQTIQKLTEVEITPEVTQEVESRIVAVKDVLATTADLVSLGQVVIPLIAQFFRVVN